MANNDSLGLKPMRIWIDGFEANVAQRLGSSQVAFKLLKNLEKIDKKNSYTILLSSKPLDDLPKERNGWRYQILKIKRFKTYLGIPYALFSAKEKPDLVFSPTHYGPIASPAKNIICIFDLAFLKFPKLFKRRDLYQLNLWTKISANRSSHIVTISESTKKDIEKYYKTPSSEISVCYPGFDPEVFHPVKDNNKIKQVREKYHISSPYIIYIGTIQPRKNLVKLIEAFGKVTTSQNLESRDLKLVIVGKTKGQGRQAWMFEETLSAPKKFGVEDEVVFTGFAPTEELPYLLSGAQAYILPSFYEGFGIPVVEAMACGTPVIVSNISSLPEVVGDAGILVDPNDVNSIAQAIEKVVKDKNLREKLSRKSLEQSKKFSWEKMCKKVLEVFEKVGSEG